MFCGKCGALNSDNASFCTSCGAKLSNVSSVNMADGFVPKRNNKNRSVGLIAAAAAVILIVVLGVTLFGGRSPEATVKKCINGLFNAEAKEFWDLIPGKMIDYMMEEEFGSDYDDIEDAIDLLSEQFRDQMDSFDYLGDSRKVSYEILSDEDIKSYELDDIKDMYEEYGVKVSAAKNVNLRVTISGSWDQFSNTTNLSLIKVGRSWYIDIFQ